jgi:cyclase
MLFKLFFTCCVVLFSLLSYANKSEAKVAPFEIAKLSESLYIVTDNDYGTNIGVVISDSATVLIDPMPGEGRFNDLHAQIKLLSKQPIKYVINTHRHEDHTGGNDFFKKLGATIVDSDVLESQTTQDSENSSNKIRSHLTKLGLMLSQVKSHTYNDVLVSHQASNAIFVGDVFDNSWHPTFYAGGLAGLNSSIDTIFSMTNKSSIIVPGHGKTANKELVDAFRMNTIAWVKLVSKLHKNQVSIDEMMNDKNINELLQRFNTENTHTFIPQNAFRRFIERTVEIIATGQK